MRHTRAAAAALAAHLQPRYWGRLGEGGLSSSADPEFGGQQSVAEPAWVYSSLLSKLLFTGL